MESLRCALIQMQLLDTSSLLDLLPWYPLSYESSQWSEMSFLLFNSDIRLDWQTYNEDKDDKKLVDLLLFFGDPFPLKDTDENETPSTGNNSESEIVVKLDEAAVPCGSVYPTLQTTDEVSC